MVNKIRRCSAAREKLRLQREVIFSRSWNFTACLSRRRGGACGFAQHTTQLSCWYSGVLQGFVAAELDVLSDRYAVSRLLTGGPQYTSDICPVSPTLAPDGICLTSPGTFLQEFISPMEKAPLLVMRRCVIQLSLRKPCSVIPAAMW